MLTLTKSSPLPEHFSLRALGTLSCLLRATRTLSNERHEPSVSGAFDLSEPPQAEYLLDNEKVSMDSSRNIMYTSFASMPSKYLILILTVRFLKGRHEQEERRRAARCNVSYGCAC
jgi:uncharacterized membrane protein